MLLRKESVRGVVVGSFLNRGDKREKDPSLPLGLQKRKKKKTGGD